MAGPLVQVDTIVAGVNLDISRLLYTGSGNLIFKVPDTNQIDKTRTLLVLTQGFDRSPVAEGSQKADAVPAVFVVADLTGDLKPTLEEKNLMVQFNEELFQVAHISKITESEGQVYTITCKTRNIRNSYFDK